MKKVDVRCPKCNNKLYLARRNGEEALVCKYCCG